MHVDAMLCDAATVREGLLHIIGGGVSLMMRQAYPGPLGLSLAVQFTLPNRHPQQHQLDVSLKGRDDAILGSVSGTFGIAEGPQPDLEAETTLCLVVPMASMPVPEPGGYVVELSVDRAIVRRIKFAATVIQTEVVEPTS